MLPQEASRRYTGSLIHLLRTLRSLLCGLLCTFGVLGRSTQAIFASPALCTTLRESDWHIQVYAYAIPSCGKLVWCGLRGMKDTPRIRERGHWTDGLVMSRRQTRSRILLALFAVVRSFWRWNNSGMVVNFGGPNPGCRMQWAS
jgi:hypothetical protein